MNRSAAYGAAESALLTGSAGGGRGVAERRRRLTWVRTTGGPHLVVPQRYAASWDGVDAPRRGRVVRAKFRYDPSGPATDYDRACDVAGWLGVIRVGRGSGLVLAGDVTVAAYYPWERKHYLLRWLCAPSEASLLDHFHRVAGSLPVEEEVDFRHPGGKLVLMDSSDIPREWCWPHAEFDLPAGRYRVSASYSESEKVGLIVHRLRRRAGAGGRW
jgi:hypothetical protein